MHPLPRCLVAPVTEIQVCMDTTADVLLAYKMNGEELAPDHGYPIRLIVPGYIGGRMVGRWTHGYSDGTGTGTGMGQSLNFFELSHYSTYQAQGLGDGNVPGCPGFARRYRRKPPLRPSMMLMDVQYHRICPRSTQESQEWTTTCSCDL